MSSDQPTSDASEEIRQLLAAADQAFLDASQQRLSKGEAQYGSTAFLSVDTIEEAMAEIVDLSNYARFTFIKLWILRQQIDKLVQRHPATDAKGFVSMKEFMQGG